MSRTITGPAPAEIADVLDKAADHIDAVGWYQGYLYDGTQADEGTPKTECRACVVGAINFAVYGSLTCPQDATGAQVALAYAAEDRLLDHIQAESGDRNSIPGWNDYPNTTADDVTAALRAAAANLRGAA